MRLLNPEIVFRPTPSADSSLPGQFMHPYIPLTSRRCENSSGVVTGFKSEAEHQAYLKGRMWSQPKEQAILSQFSDLVSSLRGRSPLEDLAALAIESLTALEERPVYFVGGTEPVLIATLLSEGQRVTKILTQPLDFWRWEKQGKHKEFHSLLDARDLVVRAYEDPNARIRVRPESLSPNVTLGEVKPSSLAAFLSKLNTRKGRVEFGVVFKLEVCCPPDMSPFVSLENMLPEIREDFEQAGIIQFRDGVWRYTNAFREALDDF